MSAEMSHQSLRDIVILTLRLNILVLIFDFATVVLYSLLSGADLATQLLKGLLPILLLLEAGLILLVGSLSVLSSTVFFTKIREYVFHSEEKWSMERYQREERKALPYIMVGIMLFGETVILSFV